MIPTETLLRSKSFGRAKRVRELSLKEPRIPLKSLVPAQRSGARLAHFNGRLDRGTQSMLRFIKHTGIVVGALSVLVFFCIYIGARYPASRPLTEAEKELAHSIYGDQIRLDSVRIAPDSIYSIDVSKTIGDTIHIRTADYNSDLSYKTLLIHELGHVWQYQNGGWGYIPKSLVVQFVAFSQTGSTSAAYNWEEDFLKGTPWEKLNPEQQAESIAEYFYYREIGGGQELKRQLECFIPFLRNNSCE